MLFVGSAIGARDGGRLGARVSSVGSAVGASVGDRLGVRVSVGSERISKRMLPLSFLMGHKAYFKLHRHSVLFALSLRTSSEKYRPSHRLKSLAISAHFVMSSAESVSSSLK